MRFCPNCHKENPSVANHCMFCGTLLIDEEPLTEEEKLKAKLKEAEKENQLLKDVLEAQLKTSESGKEEQRESVGFNKEVESKVEQTTSKEASQASGKNGHFKLQSIGKYLLLLLCFLLLVGFLYLIVGQKKGGEVNSIKIDNKEGQGNVVISGTPGVNTEVAEKVKSFVKEYSELTETGRTDLVYKLYAPMVDRYHDVYNVSAQLVAEKYANYDKKFGVYGKHSQVRWNTLSFEIDGEIIHVQYIEDYTIDRYDDSKYSIFELEKHIDLNNEFRVISVYDRQLSKKKK